MKELFEFIYDLITEFDEMGFVPTTTVPEDPEVYAIRWRDAMIEALQDLSKQSEGEWKWISDDDVICSACGKVFYTADNADAGLSIWSFCPNCGAKMKGGE